MPYPPQGSGVATDNTTLEYDPTTGRLRIKDLGVSRAKLTNFVVSEMKLGVQVRSGLKHLHWAMAKGLYYSVDSLTASTTTTHPSDTDIRFFPFIFPNTVTIDRIRVNVSTAGSAGNLMRLAFYTSNQNPADEMTANFFLPYQKIANTEFEFDTSTTGVKELAITTGFPQLNAGEVYWVATQNNNVGATKPTLSASSLIAQPLLGNSATVFTTNITQLDLPATYGVLPNTLTTTDWANLTTSSLVRYTVQVRIQSIISHS